MDVRLKESEITLDGKRYVLRCNMNVLADVQEAYDGKIMLAVRSKNTVKSVLAFLAAMLNDYNDETGSPDRFTPREVGRLIEPSRLEEIVNSVMALVVDSMKSDKPQEETEKSGEQNTEDGEKNL
jgi:hypothetical protein